MATTLIMITEHPNFRDMFRVFVRGGAGQGLELQGGRYEDC